MSPTDFTTKLWSKSRFWTHSVGETKTTNSTSSTWENTSISAIISVSHLNSWGMFTFIIDRSQCIILSRCNILRHWRREKANLRIKAILNPWKLFFLINSYKFILKRKKYTHNYTVNYKAAHLCKTEKASTHRAIVCGL